MAATTSECPFMEDLITEILLRLPVKKLLRFTIVCKQWQAIITSKKFMQNHFNHKSNSVNLLVDFVENIMVMNGVSSFDQVHTFSSFHAEPLEAETLKIQNTPELPGQIQAMSGPCNGIFCVETTTYRGKMALWNPATRKLRMLPSPPPQLDINRIGFGTDPASGEFKIVLFHGHDLRVGNTLAIYASGNDSWRSLKSEVVLDSNFYLSNNHGGAVFINGFCYWKYESMSGSWLILAFDMHHEVFKVIKKPEEVEKCTDLVMHKDCLALFSYGGIFSDFVDLWVMEEQDCWKKLFSFSLFLHGGYTSPLGFRSANKFLFSSELFRGRHLMISELDMVSGKSTLFKVPKTRNSSSGEVSIVQYKESLISV